MSLVSSERLRRGLYFIECKITLLIKIKFWKWKRKVMKKPQIVKIKHKVTQGFRIRSSRKSKKVKSRSSLLFILVFTKLQSSSLKMLLIFWIIFFRRKAKIWIFPSDLVFIKVVWGEIHHHARLTLMMSWADNLLSRISGHLWRTKENRISPNGNWSFSCSTLNGAVHFEWIVEFDLLHV